jgi:hypothetical protein
MKRFLILGLLLFIYPAIATAECVPEYDEAGNTIGVMYTVYIQAPPDQRVCGQWFQNNQIATTPNPPHRPMTPYCRRADDKGQIFFTYRYRGGSCEKAATELEFRRTN